MDIFIFCALLFFVFFLSRSVTRLLSRLLIYMFHSQAVAIHALSFLFLPGVILHELSHLLIANLLFVPTGEIEFLPEIRGDHVKMGSVAIAQTDPLRRFLIGVAPIIGGFGIMLLSSYYLFATVFSWQSLLLLYIIFQIANTMFSSSKDMEGALGFSAGILLLGIVLQALGLPVWQFVLKTFGSTTANVFFLHLSLFLAVAAGLDIGIVLAAKFFLRLTKR